MKIIDNLRRTLALMVLGVGVLAGLPANAIVGTAADTVVINDVVLTYAVNGTAQDDDPIEASTSFRVDQKFDVVVQRVTDSYAAEIADGANAVAPDQATGELLFDVVNQSNYHPDIIFAGYENDGGGVQFAGYTNSVNGESLTLASAPATDVVSITYNLDEAATDCGTYSALTGGTNGQEGYLPSATLAGDDADPGDGSQTFRICLTVGAFPTASEIDTAVDAPATGVKDENFVAYSLVAAWSDAGTWSDTDDSAEADIAFEDTDTGTPSAADALQLVFADLTEHTADEDFFYEFGTGVTGVLGAEADGQHSDTGAFVVRRAVLEVTKSSLTVWDPINGALAGSGVTATQFGGSGTEYDTYEFDGTNCTTCPKAIPGAVVQYHVTVENTGSATADTIEIQDAIQTANLDLGVQDSGAGFLTNDAQATILDGGQGGNQVLVRRCLEESLQTSPLAAEEQLGFLGAPTQVDVTLGSCAGTNTSDLVTYPDGESADIFYYVTII